MVLIATTKKIASRLDRSMSFTNKIISNGELKTFNMGSTRATTEEFIAEYIADRLKEAGLDA